MRTLWRLWGLFSVWAGLSDSVSLYTLTHSTDTFIRPIPTRPLFITLPLPGSPFLLLHGNTKCHNDDVTLSHKKPGITSSPSAHPQSHSIGWYPEISAANQASPRSPDLGRLSSIHTHADPSCFLLLLRNWEPAKESGLCILNSKYNDILLRLNSAEQVFQPVGETLYSRPGGLFSW